MRRTLVMFALAALSVPVVAQDKQVEPEKKLNFNFRDASIDTILKYVSSETGWIFIQEKPSSSTVTAVSDTAVPVSKCLDFLNAAIRPAGRVILNPYSPALPKEGQTLKVLDVSDAMKRGFEIYVGSDIESIPLTDQVRTQIIPLKAVNVIDVQKELGEVLRSALAGSAGDSSSGTMAISTYSNSVILTGRSEGISRAVRILKVIDVSTSAELKIKVFPLRNADATETAKTLNEVFKKETMKAETGQQNPMGNIWRMFGGGGGGGREGRGGGEGGGGGGPAGRALAHEMVRITAEVRTNSVIVSATDDNMKIIEDLILRLDDKSATAIKLKLYALRYADATTVAKLVNDLFAETPTNSSSGNRGGQRGGGMMPVWMGGGGAAGSGEPQGATKEVRAVADIRTNAVLVAASEQRLVLIDAVMMEIDRQVNDLLEVKIYKLENADPKEMATILQALFRPQVQATTNAGGSGGGGRGGNNNNQFGGPLMAFSGGSGRTQNSGGGSSLLPSQEVEITSDVRTRSVICKASKDYIAIIDDVVKRLDQDPTETVSTYVIPLRNADAANLSVTLQNLLRTTGTNGSGNNMNQMNRGANGQNQQANPFSGMQQGNQNQFGSSSSRGGSSRGGSTGGGRFGNLGPLEGPAQDPGAPSSAQDEEARRAIEGQADIQADTTTNSLVIRTSPRNFQSIQGLLRDLDRMRPQVLIKVLIADVTLDQNTQFGVQGFWENKMTVPGGDKATNHFETKFPLATSGLTYTLTGDEFKGTLNLFASEGKLRVLATPRIMVLDNQTANINVGKDVPRVTNTTINALGNVQNSVTYESIGIMLNVTPHINPDGLVTMIIAPEISDVASAAEAVPITEGVSSPTFNVNRAQTTVAVRNGTTVVIGGLIRDSLDDSVSKIPVLGDIPLIGALFSSTSKRTIKRELMIFLTPYVAYTAMELEEITQLEKSRLKIMDLHDIEAESDRWLERIRK